MKKTPIYYHIPKSGGTYCLSYFTVAARRYWANSEFNCDFLQTEKDYSTFRCIQCVNNEEKVTFRVLIGDKNLHWPSLPIKKRIGSYTINIDEKFLNKSFFENTKTLFLEICPAGFSQHENILDLFNNLNFYKFTIIREPFSRAQSIYFYNTGSNSRHDAQHGCYNECNSFENFIMSNKLSDSWLIRSLLKLKDNSPILEKDFQKVKNLLKSFNICDINDIENVLNKTALDCYGFNIKNLKLSEREKVFLLQKNEGFYKKNKFKELHEKQQSIFELRAYWDIRLYNELLNVI
jgi:hypothetical protein